jgi:hypothetical protein
VRLKNTAPPPAAIFVVLIVARTRTRACPPSPAIVRASSTSKLSFATVNASGCPVIMSTTEIEPLLVTVPDGNFIVHCFAPGVVTATSSVIVEDNESGDVSNS